jgi:hypothetical protein
MDRLRYNIASLRLHSESLRHAYDPAVARITARRQYLGGSNARRFGPPIRFHCKFLGVESGQ